MNRFIILLKVDSEPKLVKANEPITLEQLQEWVGGDIEVIQLGHQMILVVNEEGLFRDMKLNHLATQVADRSIVGPAVICYVKGMNMVGVTHDVAKMILDSLKEA